jgi:SET domain
LPSIQAVEASLPWHVEYSSRAGRHAVANEDLPAGTLVMVEQPFLRLPLSKFAAAVCTRCLRTLQQSGEVPPPGNPCLPRYCVKCKEQPTPLDAQLAALRIKLAEIADANKLDPLMFNILINLDLQRSGVEIAVPPAADMPAKSLPTHKQSFDDIRCSVADYDSMPNMWDRKSEAWRKKFGSALRALHKELTTLSEAGTVANYKVSPLTRLQADAATETGIALFPALSAVFHHSCLPNAQFIVSSSRIFVRTLLPITKGTQITVAYVQITEPRNVRQTTLENERYFTCNCPRCTGPLKSSVDRFLEGVICTSCSQDVMLPAEGAENDAAREDWKERMKEMKAEDEKNQAARAKKAAAKSKAKKAIKSIEAPPSSEATEENPAEEDKAEAEKGENGGEDGAQKEDDAEEQQQELQNSDDLPENIPFWRCCTCEAVLPAHTVDGYGPGDVIAQASNVLQRGITYIGIKHPELAAQGETLLESVANGMDGRLAVYHNYVTTAQAPLININMRKGESLKVIAHAVQLWQTDRELSEMRPSLQQMQCLEAVIEAAATKATAAHSSVIKKQLEKKVKQAKEELKLIRPVLLGEP